MISVGVFTRERLIIVPEESQIRLKGPVTVGYRNSTQRGGRVGRRDGRRRTEVTVDESSGRERGDVGDGPVLFRTRGGRDEGRVEDEVVSGARESGTKDVGGWGGSAGVIMGPEETGNRCLGVKTSSVVTSVGVVVDPVDTVTNGSPTDVLRVSSEDQETFPVDTGGWSDCQKERGPRSDFTPVP